MMNFETVEDIPSDFEQIVCKHVEDSFQSEDEKQEQSQSDDMEIDQKSEKFTVSKQGNLSEENIPSLVKKERTFSKFNWEIFRKESGNTFVECLKILQSRNIGDDHPVSLK